jgi:hypothetical protein
MVIEKMRERKADEEEERLRIRRRSTRATAQAEFGAEFNAFLKTNFYFLLFSLSYTG